MTWTLPELEVGAGLGLKPRGLGELEGEDPEPDGRAPDPAAGETLTGTCVRVWWAAPGKTTTTAPAAATLASATVVVTELTLARPASRAATRWSMAFPRELWVMCDT